LVDGARGLPGVSTPTRISIIGRDAMLATAVPPICSSAKAFAELARNVCGRRYISYGNRKNIAATLRHFERTLLAQDCHARIGSDTHPRTARIFVFPSNA
jgi:hypothetical protein